jgi:uncharacterized membrane protein required for colicin V production
MSMYDWVVIAIAAAFLIRGWRRGAVREAIDIALLLFGTIVVFRLSPMVGTIVSGMANVPYEVGRVIGGGLIFLVLVLGSLLMGRLVAGALHVVPGGRRIDRLGGSAVGLGYALVAVVLGTTLMSAIPLPASARSAVDDSIAESSIGSVVIDPEGPIQPAVSLTSGETVLTSVVAVREAVGERIVAGTVPVPFPPADRSEIAPSQQTALEVFDAVNRERIVDGIDPLAWSPDLAIVAVSRAQGVYTSGILMLDDQLDEALRAAGIPGTTSDDLVFMAASADGLAEAIVSAPSYRAIITDTAFRKAGVGVIEGPYGLIAVQVLSG